MHLAATLRRYFLNATILATIETLITTTRGVRLFCHNGNAPQVLELRNRASEVSELKISRDTYLERHSANHARRRSRSLQYSFSVDITAGANTAERSRRGVRQFDCAGGRTAIGRRDRTGQPHCNGR